MLRVYFHFLHGWIRLAVNTNRGQARRTKPSEVFKRFFGPENGIDLPPPDRYGYRPVESADEDSV